MQNDRQRCLAEFAEYYRTHCDAVVEPAESGNASFSRSAVHALYDSYCRDSVGRLYDAVTSVGALDKLRRRPLAILDVSCFATTQLFRIVFPDARVHACDKHLKWHPFLDGVEARLCNLERDSLPYEDGIFDLVIFTETLEHIPRSPYAILGEIHRVLKRGGTLLFSVPNLCALRNRIKLMLGRDILSVELFNADSFGHFREYSMREAEYLCRAVGLEPQNREYVYYRPALGDWGRHLASAGITEVLSRPLTWAVPSLRPVCQVVAVKHE
jgi:SAM-dependent methyltransferase